MSMQRKGVDEKKERRERTEREKTRKDDEEKKVGKKEMWMNGLAKGNI